MPKPRRPANLTPLRTMRIFCEGEKTEPQYLKCYLRAFADDDRRSVVEVEKTDKNTALQLVDQAIAAKRSRNAMPDDEFWVVYDRESPAKYSDQAHAKALTRALAAGVNVALTNVCFEYWLLLHFVNTSAPYSSYDDLARSSPFKAEYKKASGRDYDKATSMAFDVTCGALSEARERAKRLNATGISEAHLGRNEPFHVNPYVGVVLLLDAIDQFK